VIKAAGKTAFGTDLLVLGLSGENVTRLAAGEPVLVTAQDLAALGLPEMMVVICYGRTEQAVLDELRGAGLGPLRGLPE
jgi:hypothetical protein